MKIIAESNLKDALDGVSAPDLPIYQKGTEKMESIKTHFLFLGEIAKIRTVEGVQNKFLHFRHIITLFLPSEGLCPIETYSLEVSVWKVVALVVLLPIFFIQRIFGSTAGPLRRDVTVNDVEITAVWKDSKRDRTELKLKKIQPRVLFADKKQTA